MAFKAQIFLPVVQRQYCFVFFYLQLPSFDFMKYYPQHEFSGNCRMSLAQDYYKKNFVGFHSFDKAKHSICVYFCLYLSKLASWAEPYLDDFPHF